MNRGRPGRGQGSPERNDGGNRGGGGGTGGRPGAAGRGGGGNAGGRGGNAGSRSGNAGSRGGNAGSRGGNTGGRGGNAGREGGRGGQGFDRNRGQGFNRDRLSEGRDYDNRDRGSRGRGPRDDDDGDWDNERGSGDEQNDERDLLVFGKNTIVSYLERMDEEEEPSEQTQEINKIFMAEGAVADDRVRKIKHLAGKLGIPVVNCHPAKLDTMVGRDSRHQGVVAQISPIKLLEFAEWLERLVSEKEERESSGNNLDGYMIVVLDGIEDPRNVGAIIRSAESQGVKAVLIPERRAAQVTDTVAKTSAGAIAHIPIVRIVNTVRALEDLKEHGFWVMGLAADAPQPLYRMDLKRPLVIVVGSEGKGLRPLVVSTCDLMGSIPLPGKTESLNASVALGIAVYEAVRQNTSNI